MKRITLQAWADRIAADRAKLQDLALEMKLRRLPKPQVSPPRLDWCERMKIENAHVPVLPIDRLRKLPEQQDCTGIYFLWLGEKLQYVGKSVDVWGRTRRHENEFRIDFDTWTSFSVEEASLKEYERAYIATYKPPYNYLGDNPGT